MSTAFNRTTFPLVQLSKNLALSPDTVQDICTRHGITQNQNGDLQMNKKDFKTPNDLSWFQVQEISSNGMNLYLIF